MNRSGNPLPSIETVYETTPKRPKYEIQVDDDYGYDAVEVLVKEFCRKNFDEIVCPYLMPYL